MNDFEREISYLRLGKDWQKNLDLVKGVVRKYVSISEHANCFRDSESIEECNLQVVAFKYSNEEYMFIETINPQTRKRDGFQLEKALTRYSSRILVSSSTSPYELYCGIYQLVMDGKLKIM